MSARACWDGRTWKVRIELEAERARGIADLLSANDDAVEELHYAADAADRANGVGA